MGGLWVDVLVINYEGRPAAWVSRDRIELFPRIAVLEPDHPARRWVMCCAIFAMQVLAGYLTGPFSQLRADHFTRCALIADEEFAFVLSAGDAALAEYFNVPLRQIGEKRLDLLTRCLDEKAE